MRPIRSKLNTPLRATLLVAACAACAAGVWLVATGGDRPPARTITYTIPPGAKRSVDRGAGTVAIPERVTGRVGDVMRIENNDAVVHFVSGYSVDSGQILNIPLRRAGTFVTDCSLHRSRRMQIVVLER